MPWTYMKEVCDASAYVKGVGDASDIQPEHADESDIFQGVRDASDLPPGHARVQHGKEAIYHLD